jgi:hypothetical protein
MQKAIVAYLIILVLMVIAALFLANSAFFRLPAANIIYSTTVPANSATSATTTVASVVKSSSTITVSLPTTSVYLGSCQSTSQTAAVPSGNFSTGTYRGWNVSGAGFGSAPFNIIYANNNTISGYYGAPWSGYVGTFFATTYHGGLSLQPGNLTSNPFEVTEPYLNFKIISPQSNLLYVEILNHGRPAIVVHYNTYVVANATNAFVNASIPLTTLLCQNVSVRIVAGVVGPAQNLNYIAVGDFSMGASAMTTPNIGSINITSH